MTTIDQLRCMSLKNKTSVIQCTNKKQIDSDYCGIHKRSKKIIRFDKQNIDQQNIDNKIVKILLKDKIIKSITSPIYTINQILNCNNISDLNTPILKQTIKELKITPSDNIVRLSKRELYVHLYNYYKKQVYYKNNISKLVKCQSVIRRYLVYKRSRCINDDDICTTQNKYEIPSIYYFDFVDDNGFRYCFDIRSFAKLLESAIPTNPYTMEPISKHIVEKFKKRINENNVSLDFDKQKITAEQAFSHRMVEIFHKFDMLDNYTDHTWFSDLSLFRLKELYSRAEDIWNYRSQLIDEQKERIVKNGIAFNIPILQIRKINIMNKRKLQNILLDEFDRFVMEGEDINERKLGAMLMLTALVEVSQRAANALPHLVQFIG